MYTAKAETQVNIASWQRVYTSFSKFGCIFPQGSEADRAQSGQCKDVLEVEGSFPTQSIL